VFSASVMPTPAAATEARGAIKMCDKNPNCSYKVNDNGSVDLQVSNAQGIQVISCPQKGECRCDLCQHPARTGPKKGLKANVASMLTGGVAGNPSGGTSARLATSWNQSELRGVYDRSDIATACANAGGKPWSNLDSYGCDKENCDGKGQGDAHTCRVSCKSDTRPEPTAQALGSDRRQHSRRRQRLWIARPGRDRRAIEHQHRPRIVTASRPNQVNTAWATSFTTSWRPPARGCQRSHGRSCIILARP
jgi:hypothetical protein